MSRRHGFTILELLVTIGIVAMLAALILPAVQHSREISRQVQCQNHLHQLGVASAISIDADGTFPVVEGEPGLMPNTENAREIWFCPSDGYGIGSYLWNDGTGVRLATSSGMFLRPGSQHVARNPRPADIVDGLSHTVAMSERLVALHTDRDLSESQLSAEPLRYLWYIPRRCGTVEELREACVAHSTTPAPFNHPTNSIDDIGYDHNLPPNHRGCHNWAAEDVGWRDLPLAYASIITATSHHPGHVHVLLCDGSVRRAHDEIEQGIWQALGTRNGSETLAW